MACEIDAFLTRQGLWNMHANLLRGCVQSRVQHNRHNLFRVCTFNVETFSSFNFFWVLSSREYCRGSRYFISCLYKNHLLALIASSKLCLDCVWIIFAKAAVHCFINLDTYTKIWYMHLVEYSQPIAYKLFYFCLYSWWCIYFLVISESKCS